MLVEFLLKVRGLFIVDTGRKYDRQTAYQICCTQYNPKSLKTKWIFGEPGTGQFRLGGTVGD